MKNLKLQILILSVVWFLGFGASAPAQEVFQGPGGCATKEECKIYCDEDGHKEECLAFALESGLMSEEEVARARKFLNQTGPGGCRGDECRTYCDNPANTDECIRFAEQSGLIKPGEAERLRKFREIEERGGPGGCHGKECRTYCEDESRLEECFAFARDNGLIGEEDIKQYEVGLKIREEIQRSGGPGGCKDEKECHSYCSNPDYIEECVAFGAAHSGMSPEEIRKMLQEFKEGSPRGDPQFDEDHFRKKFEDYGAEFKNRESDHMPDVSEYRGPGGCHSEESCREYCMSHPEECGHMMPEPQNIPQEYRPPEGQYEQFQQQYQQYTPQYQGEYQPQPTSYDHSKSLISNVISAFLAPFRK